MEGGGGATYVCMSWDGQRSKVVSSFCGEDTMSGWCVKEGLA